MDSQAQLPQPSVAAHQSAQAQPDEQGSHGWQRAAGDAGGAQSKKFDSRFHVVLTAVGMTNLLEDATSSNLRFKTP